MRKRSSTDPVESVLAEWWQELLGYEHVGLDDDFFDLGGQSLIVVRLFSKIKKTYGANFNLSILVRGADRSGSLRSSFGRRTGKPTPSPRQRKQL